MLSPCHLGHVKALGRLLQAEVTHEDRVEVPSRIAEDSRRPQVVLGLREPLLV